LTGRDGCLQEGEVKERGSHEELVAHQGIYHTLLGTVEEEGQGKEGEEHGGSARSRALSSSDKDARPSATLSSEATTILIPDNDADTDPGGGCCSRKQKAEMSAEKKAKKEKNDAINKVRGAFFFSFFLASLFRGG
jgi:hypothetical protein